MEGLVFCNKVAAHLYRSLLIGSEIYGNGQRSECLSNGNEDFPSVCAYFGYQRALALGELSVWQEIAESSGAAKIEPDPRWFRH